MHILNSTIDVNKFEIVGNFGNVKDVVLIKMAQKTSVA